MSSRLQRLLMVGLIGLLLGAAPHPSVAAEGGTAPGLERAALMAVDIFPIRFGGFLRTLVGGVILVPATILSGLTFPFERNPAVFRENAELYVVEPFDYTFRRPLGEDFAGS